MIVVAAADRVEVRLAHVAVHDSVYYINNKVGGFVIDEDRTGIELQANARACDFLDEVEGFQRPGNETAPVDWRVRLEANGNATGGEAWAKIAKKGNCKVPGLAWG